MFPFLSFATGGKALGWIYPLVPFPGPSHAGGLCVCTCICLFLSRLAPAAVRCSSLVAWGKTEHASYEKVFLKGCLKWHRTQGLMSNLSKPGVNAAAEACGAAEALRKVRAPGCHPTASLGEETSPEPPCSPSLCCLCLVSEGGDRGTPSHNGAEVCGNEVWSLSAFVWAVLLL